ncbi:NAD(P)/FAD-dependent oxidoreductase [Flexibacterium corallicola]|uniref:NAD(P)/FAD-dependent oxidoreductase n=1 Tax=Flexibacterium corallicola TaxID=3037259 RepID=UPI00286F1163|nr:FAD-dependent oxidoreductase [Pseudovibrio sp. M1P-2-3]
MKAYDLVIIGGGIFGLSIAKAAIDQGLSVAILDKNKLASGASNGLVGVLMPHIPARWNTKKQFQFDALSELAESIEELESSTGVSTGYSRCGRIIPIYTQAKLDHALERSQEAKTRWKTSTTGFDFKVLTAPLFDHWLSPSVTPLGYSHDTLAARAIPRQVCAALRAYITSRVDIFEHSEFQEFDEGTGEVSIKDGTSIRADKVAITAGFEGYKIIERLSGQSVGTGVKGQSLLLKKTFSEELPVIYDDGIYIVPHTNGTVAIGSTSENKWETLDPISADVQEMHRKALALCPSLQGAPILSSWAGARPKCFKRDPLIGLIPDFSKTFVATGGFKISYGIAHRVAKALLQTMYPEIGQNIEIPPSFKTDFHFSRD